MALSAAILSNGDMVGHTGNLLATGIAVESVDLLLGPPEKGRG